MNEKILKYFSFLLPVKLESRSSPLVGELQISYENGKKVLNGPKSNYSFGRLEQVFRYALRFYGFRPNEGEQILLLGFGGGSLLRIFRQQYPQVKNCTAVEIDPVVIELAHKHFPQFLQGVKLVEADAYTFLQQADKRYHYIFIDVFEDDTVPEQFLTGDWIKLVAERMEAGGTVFHNVMLSTEREQELLNLYNKYFQKVEVFSKYGTNLVVKAVTLQ